VYQIFSAPWIALIYVIFLPLIGLLMTSFAMYQIIAKAIKRFSVKLKK
jgi:hypothetical protein